MVGELYIVATPIGNLGDITIRAVDVLKSVGAVVCEDTRVTKKLLNHLAINKPLISWHHHSSVSATNLIIQKIKQGESLAYVSDAGTPGVSDPGGVLVKAAIESGIKVIPTPGVSAITALLQIAGINLQSFVFLGFPPHKKGRQTFWREIGLYKQPVIFFESTYRVLKALKEIDTLYPNKQLVVGRELTKTFETVYRGTAQEILEQLNKTSTKGEFVILIS